VNRFEGGAVKIGIAGVGRMGAAMATRLMGLNRDVSVWNRSPERTKAVAEAGAKVAATAHDLAETCDIVLSCVTDAAAIEETYRGRNGLLAGEVKGKLFIEMSTVRPEVPQRLAAAVKAKGAGFVDCPVGGSVGPAREGKLFGFIGGEASEVSRARQVLDQLCRRVEHVGPVGSGARMKLTINLPLHIYWQAVGEALAISKSLGLDAARVIDILADTSGGPNVLKTRGSAFAAALSGRDVGPIAFDIDSTRKDLRTMIEEAHALGVELPVTERTLECFDEASREGLGAGDACALPARFLGVARRSPP
jgi:3-hydroxyisobutyrate dehydrogenase